MIPNARLRAVVAQRFRGHLLRGTLRREISSTVDGHGDPIIDNVETYPFEGLVDSFSAFSANQHGVPLTDAKITIIAGSLAIQPMKDDKVMLRNQWFQLRTLTLPDTVNAVYEFAGFEIPAP